MTTATVEATRFVRRPDLVVKPSSNGRFVAKDPGTGKFFSLGEQEVFLLERLGQQSDAELIAGYEAKFGEALSEKTWRVSLS